MVTKVGSAGQVIESVIQYTQNENKHETKAEGASDKHVKKPISHSAGLNRSTDRKVSARERAQEMSSRAADSAAKSTGSTVEARPGASFIQDAAVMENADGDILENRTGMELSEEAVKITVDDVNKRIASQGAQVEFSYHEKTGRYSFKVLDKETGKVIREVPPQKSLDMVAKMFEMAGLIVDEKL